MYKLGIIGFGVVGKSALNFLKEHVEIPDNDDIDLVINDSYDEPRAVDVDVWDARLLGAHEHEMIQACGAAIVDTTRVSLKEFIEQHDFILPSPGVPLREYQEFADKFLCELDFFAAYMKKPVVAVTGSIGKTTTTRIIGKVVSISNFLLKEQCSEPVRGLMRDYHLSGKKSIRTVLGGNIGRGMLDLVKQPESYDLAVLELSSFQLDLNKKFAPDISILTNFYPNHLDRHGDLESYCEAKFNIMRYQKEHQVAIVTKNLFRGKVWNYWNNCFKELKAMVSICSHQPYDQEFIDTINREKFYFFYVDGGYLWLSLIKKNKQISKEKLFNLSVLPEGTFLQNWIKSLAALYFLGVDLSSTEMWFKSNDTSSFFDDATHRVQYFTTINGVDFYDDSKATLIEATKAAVAKLSRSDRRVLLILGGQSKGIDRSPLMDYIKSIPQIKKVYCFGPECADFADCIVLPSLEAIVDDVAKIMTPGDIVLFSPSGSSFDLFKNYKHRGQEFKKLVKKLDGGFFSSPCSV